MSIHNWFAHRPRKVSKNDPRWAELYGQWERYPRPQFPVPGDTYLNPKNNCIFTRGIRGFDKSPAGFHICSAWGTGKTTIPDQLILKAKFIYLGNFFNSAL